MEAAVLDYFTPLDLYSNSTSFFSSVSLGFVRSFLNIAVTSVEQGCYQR